MKITLLRKREDFSEIFKRSLADFLFAYFGRAVTIARPGHGDMSFRQNSELNVIFPKAIAPACLTELTAEFRYAKGSVRRWLQTAYCVLAVRPPFAQVASPPAFDLLDAPTAVAAWVFLPGNHTIRIIDTARNESLVFRKAGFNERFFLCDAHTRVEHSFLPAPRVIEIDHQGRWYREERISGLPLNRLPKGVQAETALKSIVSALASLRLKTSREVSLQQRISECVSQVRELCIQLGRHLPPELAHGVDALLADAQRIGSAAPACDITVCTGHGDLQPANILVNGSRVWLIDWEYSDTRSAIYDFLVYSTQSRFPQGLGDRLFQALLTARRDGGVSTWDILQPGPVEGLLALFLLEDLALTLSAVAAPAIRDKHSGLVAWMREVGPFTRKMVAQSGRSLDHEE